MKTKEVTLHKEMKIGLPNYSNITVGLHMTFEIGEDEQIDWDKAWDTINQQLAIQASAGSDPSWLHMNEQKNDYKVTIKTPKVGETI